MYIISQDELVFVLISFSCFCRHFSQVLFLRFVFKDHQRRCLKWQSDESRSQNDIDISNVSEIHTHARRKCLGGLRILDITLIKFSLPFPLFDKKGFSEK